jgi:2-keto-4-pentenoate hydratase
MTSKLPAAEAAHILVERRINGSQGARLPEGCRPHSLADALAIQDEVSRHWCELMDDSIGAWKCLLPPQDKLVIAPIYTRTIDSIPPVAIWPKLVEGQPPCARIEPELAFFFGIDLPAREQPYSTAEIDAAIVRTHLALELINSRYAEPAACEFAEVLADGLVNQGLFIGPQVDSDAAAGASAFTISVTCGKGEMNQYQGRHPNKAPRAPLYWLVEFMRERGMGIEAGQAVITGSFAGVIEVPLNEEIAIDYAGLGRLLVSFQSR